MPPRARFADGQYSPRRYGRASPQRGRLQAYSEAIQSILYLNRTACRRAKNGLNFFRRQPIIAQRSRLEVTSALAVLLILRLVCGGFYVILKITIMVSLVLLWANYGRLLAYLAEEGIKKTPKAFNWSIDRITIRPTLCFWSTGAPNAQGLFSGWSEIVITGWTWKNQPGFSGDKDYLLEIDRLTIRLTLLSIYQVIRNRKTAAVDIDMVLVEGLRFNTQRNRQGDLNLWEILNLPDSDVNVAYVVGKARQYSDVASLEKECKGRIKALPAMATEATRASADYWREEWGPRHNPHGVSSEMNEPPSGTSTKCAACGVGARRVAAKAGSIGCFSSLWGKTSPTPTSTSTPRQNRYIEFPIGHPLRRPRWGVPVRLDIKRVVVLSVELWIFDLLTMEKRTRFLELEDPKLTVKSLFLNKKDLEAGDLRRSGGGEYGDGLSGVYLGELVWCLVSKLLPKVFKNSPTGFVKNAGLAIVFGARDLMSQYGARGVELAFSAKDALSWPARQINSTPDNDNVCELHVHLQRGRRITDHGMRVNVHARLELIDGGAHDLQHESSVKFWTKAPWWDERFVIPIKDLQCSFRLTLFHHKSWTHSTGLRKIGELELDLEELFGIEDPEQVINQHQGDIVGWFPLDQIAPPEVGAKGYNPENGAAIWGQENLPIDSTRVRIHSDLSSQSSSPPRARQGTRTRTRSPTRVLRRSGTKRITVVPASQFASVRGELKLGLKIKNLNLLRTTSDSD